MVVDVGGGIGSTSMMLANAFPHLRFVIQDRPPVAEMGTAVSTGLRYTISVSLSSCFLPQAWRARYPELLDAGRAAFQGHDFFKPQPPFPAGLNCTDEESESASETEGCDSSGRAWGFRSSTPAVFLMRVITHDWPDSYVTR